MEVKELIDFIFQYGVGIACLIYLMYFQTYGIRIDRNFKGCVFKIETEEDLFNALRSISKTNYQVLKQKSLKLKERKL